MKSLERRADVSLTGIFQPDVRAVASHFRPPRPTFRRSGIHAVFSSAYTRLSSTLNKARRGPLIVQVNNVVPRLDYLPLPSPKMTRDFQGEVNRPWIPFRSGNDRISSGNASHSRLISSRSSKCIYSKGRLNERVNRFFFV